MKALTICQPYPHLILAGEKHVENRTWPTRYRGPLIIHAGKSRAWLDEDVHAGTAKKIDFDEVTGERFVFGAIVGLCTLADCVRVEAIEAGRLDARFPQLANRAHCGGPWCWVLTNVRAIPPIPWKGEQGLFDIPDQVVGGAS